MYKQQTKSRVCAYVWFETVFFKMVDNTDCLVYTTTNIIFY